MSDPIGDAVGGAIEHVSADAVAGIANRRGVKHHGERDPNCLNCGTELQGDFCHVCGQSGESLRRPFWSLLAEGIETLFSIDSRFARTVPDLLLRPGRMTRAYLDGQRTRFLPPFRLYVLASLVFFVVLPLVTGQGLAFMPKATANFEEARAQVEESYKEGEMTEEEYQASVERIDHLEEAWNKGVPGLIAPDVPDVPDLEVDGTDGTDPADEWEGFMPKEAADAVREAAANGNPDAARLNRIIEEPNELAKNTMRWVPRLMFVMLPLYASLLALVYMWRPQFLFFDHLIVSLHFHTALFFAMAVTGLLVPFIGMGWVVLAMIVYSNWYLYRLNRVVYGRSGPTSVLRVLTLDSIYFGLLATGLLTAVILGAMDL